MFLSPFNNGALRFCRLILLVIILVSNPAWAGKKPVIVKMATLAPEGSPWHEVLMEIAQDWRDISNDKVRLRIYAGGVIGDESDMVRKIRIGQIHAAALTAEGMSYIDRGIYALSLPLLADNYAELDWIREQVEPELLRRYESKGFVVLAWADVGWVYWFSRKPAKTPTDMQSQRIFTWAGDSESPKLWKAAGFQPVSLSAVDVLPGLQTGLIDAVDSSPMTVASFQWFGVAKYMLDLPWAAMTGAMIISRETWEQIPEDLRPALLAAVQKRALRVKDEIRYTDSDAIDVMKSHGLKVVAIGAEERQLWADLIERFGHHLRGTLVDTTMFDRVMVLKGQMDRPGFVLPAVGQQVK
ncbi:MAG: TRAP transporter substrate-binding protein DctP [Candidatus Marinimicrobia bacterium]|nr:TRAP transporter substrate-binding protein DctP [Candidatus Neomarinimicrobiota bacterium]